MMRDSVPSREEIEGDVAREEIEEDNSDENYDIPATAREQRISQRERRRLAKHSDSSNQAGGGAAEDWRHFDVSKALEALRSEDASIRRRSLMRLHVRWWHATTEELKRTLHAAGAPPKAIADIPAVVRGGVICRDRRKPPAKSIATFRIVWQFNEEVQMDLIFYHSMIEPGLGSIPVLHMIDACVRWSAGTH
jgi:hypothetical protein